MRGIKLNGSLERKKTPFFSLLLQVVCTYMYIYDLWPVK
jgi:hypothetical protein